MLGVTNEVDISNMNKANNCLVFTDNYKNASFAGSVEARLNEYSVLLANTAAHELGHALGLNHHPTDGNHYMLQADDPDNDPLTADDSNKGVSLMAYASMSVYRSGLEQLGTADLSRDDAVPAASEFRIGQADHVTQLLWWLT